jgi:NAD(P)-dependent dehydrogenase (short-subunit alcohol dehydrogenase family)
MEDLHGKVAVVTGAASGIGRAMTERLVAEGMRVVLADVAPDLDDVVEHLRAGGADAVGVRTDVAVYEEVEALRDAALGTFGAVHLVCNNAGVGSGGVSWELPIEQWRWVIDVDLFGVIHGVKAFLPGLIEQGFGHVVNTASMAGLLSPGFMGPYNVAKHGVVTLTETLHAELQMVAPDVGVSVLCPGWVKTRIHEAERYEQSRAGRADDDEAAAATASMVRDTVEGLIANGLDPDDVAALVLDAVLTRRVYILTHPEWMPMVSARTNRIVTGEPPAIGMLPTD